MRETRFRDETNARSQTLGWARPFNLKKIYHLDPSEHESRSF